MKMRFPSGDQEFPRWLGTSPLYLSIGLQATMRCGKQTYKYQSPLFRQMAR